MEGSPHCDQIEPAKLVDVSGLIKESGKEAEHDVEEGHAEEKACNDDEDLFLSNFKEHKKNYYVEKMKFKEVTGWVNLVFYETSHASSVDVKWVLIFSEILRSQAESYIRGIQWILHYYYSGVCSWSWYYPYHYGPFISDVRNFANMKLKYELGKPFLPYEQLLAVLPASSLCLVPVAYQGLMSAEGSPISDFYPSNFQVDVLS